jgi:lipopolysaccharide assembly protein A
MYREDSTTIVETGARGTAMSAERPEASGPAQPSPDAAVPPDPEVVAPSPAEPTLPQQHTVEPTRTSMVWTMVGIGVVLSFAILVFILQNGQRVRVRFLMANGTLPLGAALLFAALLGALLVLVAGAARVLQLRVVSRRHRRADQAP